MPTSPPPIDLRTKETRRASRRVLFVTTIVALVAVVALVLTSVAFFIKSAQDAQALEERLVASRARDIEEVCHEFEEALKGYTALIVSLSAIPEDGSERNAAVAAINANVSDLFAECGELR